MRARSARLGVYPCNRRSRSHAGQSNFKLGEAIFPCFSAGFASGSTCMRPWAHVVDASDCLLLAPSGATGPSVTTGFRPVGRQGASTKMPKGIMRLVRDISLGAEIWAVRQSIVFQVAPPTHSGAKPPPVSSSNCQSPLNRIDYGKFPRSP